MPVPLDSDVACTIVQVFPRQASGSCIRFWMELEPRPISPEPPRRSSQPGNALLQLALVCGGLGTSAVFDALSGANGLVVGGEILIFPTRHPITLTNSLNALEVHQHVLGAVHCCLPHHSVSSSSMWQA